MKTFDQSAVMQIRAEMNEALAAVADKHGIKFEIGSIRYGSTSMSTKVEVLALGNDSDATSHDEVFFNSMAHRYGLQGMFGKKFASQGRVFKIIKLKPKNFKYPVIASSGKGNYKFPASTVKNLLETAPVA